MSTFARQQDDAVGLRRSFAENRRFVAWLAIPSSSGCWSRRPDRALVLAMPARGSAADAGDGARRIVQFAVYQSEAVVWQSAAVFATAFFAVAAVAVAGAIPLRGRNRPSLP